jgi:hypothetical protein
MTWAMRMVRSKVVSSDAPDLSLFFCIGCRKSGTTLLARVLDQHPQIACVWESYALGFDNPASIMNPQSDSWKKHGFSEEDVRRWASVWSPGQRDYALRARRVALQLLGRVARRDYLRAFNFRRTMTAALADLARRCHATVVGDKWPFYIDQLETLLRAFPHAKLVYSVRDPRGIWNSGQRFKQRQGGNDVLREMLEKDLRVAPYLEQPNFITVRYEDLVCSPAETCNRLYRFLGCDFAYEYLRYDPAVDPYPSRWEWIPEASDEIDPWHARKWREQMSSREIDRISTLADWFIDKYGYEG